MVLPDRVHEPSSAALPRRAKILLVDDHPANLVALEAVFEPLDCDLVLAYSGEEALKCLLRDEFALILLDVQMPGLDGFQTAAMIRARPKTRHIPIIFLTAVSKEKEFIFKGYEHGAVDYLVKPFHPDILRSKVSVFVELHKLREDNRVQAEELFRHQRESYERASVERHQRILDMMPQIVWAADAGGEVYLVNRVWREFTGLQAVDDDGAASVVHPDDREEMQERWRRARETGVPFEMEYRMRRASDGAYRWFLGRAVPETERGEVIGWIGTATDIDDQKRDRAALAAAIEAKDTFIAAASHELRTPLAAAKAQAQLTLRRLGADADPATVKPLQVIGGQIDRMTRLVEDLLDISRLRTGRLSLQLSSFDLAERLREACERIQSLTQEHQIQVEAPSELPVFADRDRLDQVINNLLTNAVRYSPSGGPIRVRADARDDALHLQVSDKGVGIPLEKQAVIFEQFGRAHGTRYGGLGLGLTIAQGIVEQHGGRIWAESTGKPGEGTTFHVELPMRAPEARATLS